MGKKRGDKKSGRWLGPYPGGKDFDSIIGFTPTGSVVTMHYVTEDGSIDEVITHGTTKFTMKGDTMATGVHTAKIPYKESITAGELKKRIGKGQLKFGGISIQDDMINFSLDNVSFENCLFSGVVFNGSVFGTSFHECEMATSSFYNTQTTGVNFGQNTKLIDVRGLYRASVMLGLDTKPRRSNCFDVFARTIIKAPAVGLTPAQLGIVFDCPQIASLKLPSSAVTAEELTASLKSLVGGFTEYHDLVLFSLFNFLIAQIELDIIRGQHDVPKPRVPGTSTTFYGTGGGFRGFSPVGGTGG